MPGAWTNEITARNPMQSPPLEETVLDNGAEPPWQDTTGAWIWRGWCIACGFLFFSLTVAIFIAIGVFVLTSMGYHLWG